MTHSSERLRDHRWRLCEKTIFRHRAAHLHIRVRPESACYRNTSSFRSRRAQSELGTAVSFSPLYEKNLSYDVARDLSPIVNAVCSDVAFIAANKVPAKDLREFVALARSSAKPLL